MTVPERVTFAGSVSPFLVGREREQAILRERLAAALAGNGSLVLIGGEAGIGKTALAEALCRDAAEQGALVLVGRCFDLAETPAYGPWLYLFERYHADGGPPLPPAFSEPGQVGAVASQAALFRQVLDFLKRIVAQRPVVLLLDDLHWADAASLDMLRFLAQSVASLSLLVIATYRSDELTRGGALYRLLPTLIREANAERLDLHRLDNDAVRLLVTNRYRLPDTEVTRLAVYLQARAEGNAFFIGELLRWLEEAGVLRRVDQYWMLGELTGTAVPSLLQQVIDGRLNRLDAESQGLLAIAAVIGHEVSLAIWATVGNVDEDALSDVVEHAITARVMEAMPDGTRVRFVHALIREALYERVLATRRRRMHLRVGELLAELPNADPDAVASHFERAGDGRAVEWLVRAGERAQRAYAWLTAAERFRVAIALLAGSDATTTDRGWLLVRLARMVHFVDPIQGITYLDEAEQLARKAGDHLLAATALYTRGKTRLFVTGTGDQQQALDEVTRGAEALEALRAESSLFASQFAEPDTPSEFRGILLYHVFARAGRYAETAKVAARFLDQTDMQTAHGLNRGNGSGDGYVGIGEMHAMLGRPDEAQRAIEQGRAIHRRDGHTLHAGWATTSELYLVLLPYQTDQVDRRRRVASESERDWGRTSEAGWRVAPRVGSLPLMVVEGDWIEARRLAAEVVISADEHVPRHFARMMLGPLAREQGAPELAWELVRAMFPSGPATAPGTGAFFHRLVMQRLAAALSLDAGDLATAREWLEAHDRWLAWSSALLGQSEGHALWAAYYRTMKDMKRAYYHVTQALTCATEPRQPLALLAAHRLLGELNTTTGRIAYAATHLDAALSLATACAAPYERALTLLALAGLRAATGQRAEALALLDDVRTSCLPLGAAPTLTKADALAARLTVADIGSSPPYPASLSAREVEVLRLMAAGESNRDIANVLFLSERTVQVHVRHILTKTGADNRAGATAFALRNNLA